MNMIKDYRLCKISVIVPVYNAEKHIERCIKSIQEQTFRNMQIILIDDGSTDESGIVCDFYAMNDNRIQVFHTENSGSVAARKLGLIHSIGEYVGFVDADDYIEPDMFETLIEEICENNVDFVHTGYIEETDNKKKIILDFENKFFSFSSLEEKADFLIRYVLHSKENQNISYSIWSKLFKRELIYKCFLSLPDEQQYGEDLLCLCKCILQCESLKLSRHALYHYTIQEQSLSHLNRVEHVIEITGLNYNILKIFQEYSEKLYKRIKTDIFFYLKRSYLYMLEKLIERDKYISYFYFKNIDDLRGKKVVIYGAGKVGCGYYLQFCRYQDIEIVAWMDSNWRECQYEFATVIGVKELINLKYENIIIAVNDELSALEIKDKLIRYGQNINRILWEKPGNILEESISQ